MDLCVSRRSFSPRNLISLAHTLDLMAVSNQGITGFHSRFQYAYEMALSSSGNQEKAAFREDFSGGIQQLRNPPGQIVRSDRSNSFRVATRELPGGLQIKILRTQPRCRPPHRS